MNFWKKLKKPIFVLAPMANVTDSAFRSIIAKNGKPDVIWTEFVSADGLISPGRKVLLKDLEFTKKEKPIIAQLFTGHPEAMEKACKIVNKLGFDGIDINMGCPDRSVEKQGGGADMIRNPKKALEVLKSARAGAPNLPISIKTRIGYNKNEIDTWIALLLEQKLPVLTVHLRTRKEMSNVPAHWEYMKDIVSLRDKISPETLIIGNGDIKSLKQAREVVEKYGCDGVMIGRGIFGNPWFFDGKENIDIPLEKRLNTLVKHAKLYEKNLGKVKSFAVMKKHFKAYIGGFEGAKELRAKCMEVNNSNELNKVIKFYLKNGTVDTRID
jgi:nifR3 family TIM-barrel protein